jgi:hypothetical protein
LGVAYGRFVFLLCEQCGSDEQQEHHCEFEGNGSHLDYFWLQVKIAQFGRQSCCVISAKYFKIKQFGILKVLWQDSQKIAYFAGQFYTQPMQSINANGYPIHFGKVVTKP